MFVGRSLSRLRAEVAVTRRSAYAEGSHKNLRVQWLTFIIFCMHYNLQIVPAEVETLSLFAQFLSRSFATVASIYNYLSGVRILHLYLGVSPPDLTDFSLKLVLTGLKRVKGHMVKQAAPITPELLVDIYPLIMLDSNGPVIWALFLTAFFLFLRKSNLVPLTPNSFDSSRQLTRGDFMFGKSSVLVTIKWSKTIQFGDRCLALPLLPIPGSVLCPVSALKHMMDKFPTFSPLDPAFHIVVNGRVTPLTYLRFQGYIKKYVSLKGLDPALYSSHSFRRGGATYAHSCGVPDNLIQLQGDWRSDAYRRYLDTSIMDRAQVFMRMASAINQSFCL